MRRLILAAALLTVACRPKKPAIIEDEAAPIAQTIEMGNPAHAKQLLEGFYPIEDNRWRWTAKRFAATVRPPLRAATTGARLVFQFAYPEPVAAKLGPITLRAKVAGRAGPPVAREGGEPGAEHVPAAVLDGGADTGGIREHERASV